MEPILGLMGLDGSAQGVERFAQPIGILGVLTYLASYFALQIGMIRGQGYLYPSLNVIAASMVLVSLMTEFNLPAAIIQISFIAISVIGLCRHGLGQFMLRLTDEERYLLDSKFPELRGHQARQFLNSGEWRMHKAGTVLTHEGEHSTSVHFVASGAVEIWSGGQCLYRYGADILIGEISSLSANPSTATAVVAEDALVFSIDAEQLRRLVSRDTEMRLCIEAGFARDTRTKVLQKNAAFLSYIRQSSVPADLARKAGSA